MLQYFVRFPEFAEFTEFNNLGKTPLLNLFVFGLDTQVIHGTSLVSLTYSILFTRGFGQQLKSNQIVIALAYKVAEYLWGHLS